MRGVCISLLGTGPTMETTLEAGKSVCFFSKQEKTLFCDGEWFNNLPVNLSSEVLYATNPYRLVKRYIFSMRTPLLLKLVYIFPKICAMFWNVCKKYFCVFFCETTVFFKLRICRPPPPLSFDSVFRDDGECAV